MNTPIQRFVGDKVTLVNPAYEVAKTLKQMLAQRDMAASEDHTAKYEYYVSDIIGCQVYNDGQLIGVVQDVQLYDHHDILVVKGKEKIMIPYVDAFIVDEDIENKRIDVHLIEGFL